MLHDASYNGYTTIQMRRRWSRVRRRRRRRLEDVEEAEKEAEKEEKEEQPEKHQKHLEHQEHQEHQELLEHQEHLELDDDNLQDGSQACKGGDDDHHDRLGDVNDVFVDTIDEADARL